MSNKNSVELSLNETPSKKNAHLFLKKNVYSIESNSMSSSSRFKQFLKSKHEKLNEPAVFKKFLLKKIPIIEWLPKYDVKSNLFADLISGNTVGVMNIPQGMAYSLLATLPPINGLYMSFFPIVIYTLLGTSKQLVTGAISIISLLTASAIEKAIQNSNVSALYLNRTDQTFDEFIADYKLSIACCLAFLVGLTQLVMGLLGVGKFLTSYFSDTFVSGYTCASALHVLTSQLKELLGLSNLKKYDGPFKIPKTWYEIFTKLNTFNLATVILSAFCIIFLVIVKEFLNPVVKKRLKFEFPSELFLLVIMTVSSYFFNFNKNYNISIVKNIPKGMPVPKLPDLRLTQLIFMDAILIACIAFSISVSLATLFSRKRSYKIEPNQELYAYSVSNMFGSCFACFPSCASLSRSSTLDTMCAKTQLASLFSSFFSFVVILWMGPLFESLTKNCLSSIIVVALKSLILQFKDFCSLWKINKLEGVTWMITFLSTLILNVDYGLFIGIGVSVLMIVINDQSSPLKSLSQYKNTSNYVDFNVIKAVKENETETNVKIIKLEHSLYFANCEIFQSNLYKSFPPVKIESVQLPAESRSNLLHYSNREHNLVLDFSAVNYVDTNGVNKLKQIVEDYKLNDFFVYICGAQESLLRILVKMKLFEVFETHLFVSIEDALNHIKEIQN